MCRVAAQITITPMGDSRVSLTHHFLIAMPSMADPHFAHTLIYLCEHNAKGALGIVINKPIDMTLSSLFEQINVPLGDSERRDSRVHYGGPVQIDRGFVLHRPLGSWQSTLAISDDLGLTTSKDILEAVGHGEGPDDVLVSLGYAGWSADQLEQEIAQNSWLTVAADADAFVALMPDGYDTRVGERGRRLSGGQAQRIAMDVAAELGVVQRPGMSLEASISDSLRTKEALVVLDNCEQLLGPVSALAEKVLRECPGVRILATSREGLAVGGEHVWPLRPLPVPATTRTVTTVATNDAARRSKSTRVMAGMIIIMAGARHSHSAARVLSVAEG